MANPSKPDELAQEWDNKIEAGKDYRSRFSTYKRWTDFRKYYRHQWADKVVPVNKIYSYGRMLIPRVYFQAPRVSITATKPELVWHAKVVEAIDNTLIRETMLKETLKKAALDAYLCGIGPIKLGYDSEFGYIPEQSIFGDGETVTQVSRKEGDRIEYKSTIKPGMPWASKVRPEDVVVPWGAVDSSSLPWIAHRVLRPLEDVKQDQKYKNTDSLVGTRTSATDSNDSPYQPKSTEGKEELYAELWEVRDFKSGSIFVFCEQQTLMATKDELQVESLPWEFIIFNPDPEYFWPIPDVAILEAQQLELNDTRTQASRHRKISLIKFLYSRGALKEEELDKFLSSNVGIAVAVDTDVLANAVIQLQPHIPPDLYREAMSIVQDMKESLGAGSNQLGEFSPYHGKTATESNIVDTSFEYRIDERKDIVADVLVNIIRKWNQYLFKFWTEERVVRITGPEGTPYWIQYTGDQLKGEYFLSVDADSGMPINKILKYQMAKDIFGLLNGDELIDQVLLRRLLLDHYRPVEPLVANLIASPPEVLPSEASAIRQPSPMGSVGAGGKAREKGMTPERPIEFEELKRGVR